MLGAVPRKLPGFLVVPHEVSGMEGSHGGKRTYAELLAYSKRLESKVETLERAMKLADRHRVLFHAMDWCSIPLKAAQVAAVRDHLEDRLYYDGRKEIGGERHYEEVHESDILPEFKHYLVRYVTDLQGEHVSTVQVWGLIPV